MYGELVLSVAVNEIFGDHNVDKQMTDSRGDVGFHFHLVCAWDA